MDATRANLRWVSRAIVAAALVALLVAVPGNAQVAVSSPCTTSMLTSIIPCMNFLTNGTTNMTTPTPGCCSSLNALASNGTGCFCQILSGTIPFRVPINRTSAISLPRSCNMAGVPLQCNLATGAPSPAPGMSTPVLTPSLSPTASATPSPSTSSIPTSPSPVSNIAPTGSAGEPTTSAANQGRSSTTSTSAAHSLRLSPSLLLLPFALAMRKYY